MSPVQSLSWVSFPLSNISIKKRFNQALAIPQSQSKTVFQNSLDSFHIAIWDRAHRKCLDRGGPFKLNVQGDQTKPPVHPIQLVCFYCQLSQLATTWGIWSVRGIIPDVHHCLVASCDAFHAALCSSFNAGIPSNPRGIRASRFTATSSVVSGSSEQQPFPAFDTTERMLVGSSTLRLIQFQVVNTCMSIHRYSWDMDQEMTRTRSAVMITSRSGNVGLI